MSSMYTKIAVAASLILSGFLFTSPAGATIINIDAFDPESAVTLDLGRGDYVIQTIGRDDGGLYDAWNAWGQVLDCDVSGRNCSNGWLTRYVVESDSLGSFMNGYDPDITKSLYATPEMALANAVTYKFWLPSTESVMFSIHDPFKSDNIGGISLRISQVPEPASFALIALGLFGISLLMRHRKKRGLLAA